MTLLNPWAIGLLLLVLFLFKNILFKTPTTDRNTFIQSHLSYIKQTRLLILALILFILALSRPAITNEVAKEKFDANEYIIALDASYSMQATDIKPTRYEVAKKSIITLLNIDVNDRFSLFAFTSKALLICPPTTDTSIALSALSALSPQYILTKGTSIKALLQSVANLDQDHKSLIIFSDGGEEHDLNALFSFAKQHAITLNIIAVASQKGSALSRDNIPLKDEKSHLIVSRINPILERLASLSGGFYFEIHDNDTDISEDVFSAMQDQNLQAQELQTDVISYKELYAIPLLLAFIVILLALTTLKKFIPFLALVFSLLPHVNTHASVLDFHYNDEAKEAYKQKNYSKAAYFYKQLSPSQYSYVALANSYYHHKEYKNAMKYYSLIQSKDPKIKQVIFYNMGNVAVKLKRYDRAKVYYQKVLALAFDKEAYDNLMTLYDLALKSKINVADMLPHVNDKEVKSITKKNEHKKEGKENDSKGSSNQQAAQATQGGSSGEEKQKNKHVNTSKKNSKNEFKMGYNAYEIINEGYTNEKHPW